jgi:hypothetical protein
MRAYFDCPQYPIALTNEFQLPDAIVDGLDLACLGYRPTLPLAAPYATHVLIRVDQSSKILIWITVTC